MSFNKGSRPKGVKVKIGRRYNLFDGRIVAGCQRDGDIDNCLHCCLTENGKDCMRFKCKGDVELVEVEPERGLTVPGNGENMPFIEMWQAVLNMKKVRRQSWPVGVYVWFDYRKVQKFVHVSWTEAFIITEYEVGATDWETVDDPPREPLVCGVIHGHPQKAPISEDD